MQQAEFLVLSVPVIALAVCLIVFLGAIVQAGLGMGFGLSVAPMLALLDPALVPGSALVLGATTAAFGAWSEREHIAWDQVITGTSGRLAGIMAGVFILLWTTDHATFSLIFGIIILVMVGLSVFGMHLRMSLTNLLSMGIISGFTGVITSVGAPPLALIYQNQPPQTARPTLATFFAFGGLLSLIALYLAGWANFNTLIGAAFMAPAAMLGTWYGRRLKGRFDKRYRQALLFIAFIASILLIFRGIAS